MTLSQESFETHLHVSEPALHDAAAKLAQNLKPPSLLLLKGDLGMGKTSFARALIRNLAGEPELIVPSPTFTLVQMYDTSCGPVYHFDLYRLTAAEQIYDLGWEDALDHIVIVEWPERLGDLIPPHAQSLTFTAGDDSDHRWLTWGRP